MDRSAITDEQSQIEEGSEDGAKIDSDDDSTRKRSADHQGLRDAPTAGKATVSLAETRFRGKQTTE
jgi:hypothetical protein